MGPLRESALQLRLTRGIFRSPNHLKRATRILAAALIGTLVLSGGALGGPKPSTRDVQTGSIVVEASSIAAFDRTHPKATHFGKLIWRGGLVLTSPSPNFGGWSGLVLGPGGKDVLAVSDAGTWMTGTLVYADGRPKGVQSVRLGPLKSLSGKTLPRFRDRDAEGLALVAGTPAKGSVLISFERNHRIGRFDIDAKGLSAPKSYVDLSAAIKRRLRANSGLEAVAVLGGGPNAGSLVAFAERLRDAAGNHIGWIWIKGRPREFRLSNAGAYDITDMAALPSGGLLVLERRFRWSEGVKVRLRLVRQQELHAGARIEGETLLEADSSQEIDNMEGLAVHTGTGGDIVVTMISDDNFNKGLQRTVLLQFALDGVDLARAGTRP